MKLRKQKTFEVMFLLCLTYLHAIKIPFLRYFYKKRSSKGLRIFCSFFWLTWVYFSVVLISMPPPQFSDETYILLSPKTREPNPDLPSGELVRRQTGAASGAP